MTTCGIQTSCSPEDIGKVIREMLIADDVSHFANTQYVMQQMTSCFAEPAQQSGLAISQKKTGVCHGQPVVDFVVMGSWLVENFCLFRLLSSANCTSVYNTNIASD